MMPGFIDTHTHLTQSLGKSLVFGEPSEIFRRIWVPLEGSLDEHMVYLSSKLAALECLRGGFTTAVDAGTRSAGHIGGLVDAARETGLRLVVAQICNDLVGAAQIPDRAAILHAAEAHLAAYEGDPLIHGSLAISIPEVASDAMLRDISQMAAQAGVTFQTHVNEHLVAVERSLVANTRRPLEHLAHVGALGPQTLIAHSTLITPHELNLLHDSGTAVAYNPVASVWKGNAVAPALQMQALGIRFGLGTDGARADGFRLMDAAETMQRAGYGLASGDSSCGGGWLWLDAATRMAADAARLSAVTGRIAAGLAADFLLVDLDRPEFTPSHDLDMGTGALWQPRSDRRGFHQRQAAAGARLAGRLGRPRPDAGDPRHRCPRHRRRADPAHPPHRRQPDRNEARVTLTVFLALSLLVGGAAFIQGAVGIGFALIMAPIFGFVDATYLPVTLLILMLPLNFLVAWREREAIDRPGASWITVGRFFGTFLGMAVLVALSVRQLEIAVGLLTILAALIALLAPPFSPGRPSALGVGLFTGVTETRDRDRRPAAGAAVSSTRPGPALRAIVATCFLVGELISLAVLLVAGRVGTGQLWAALALTPAVLAGSWLSRHVHARINGPALRLAVLIFSIVSGAALIPKG
ncbi:TSUP family transporter [Paracoccus sp. DMF-8]|uniref:TSUP family transporter n=1 Tax=Paracoccus sp. DMF-8 TaxID=3019445 RepID=UPI0023E8DA93|nr:TSUP family transporter [Paracoccus sp. DMF-8]MDF3605812.1 TSUP family transporter [Paracoccus sp. DMF-8]